MENNSEEKIYYYIDDGIKIGPLTFTELELSGTKRDTLVWHPGLDNWQPAHKIEVLKFRFPDVAPKNISQQNQYGNRNPELAVKVWKSSTYKDAPIIFMFLFLFVCFMGVVLIAASEKSEKGLGVGIVVVSLVFLGLFILFKSIGKEIYRIGINYDKGLLWVSRPSVKKECKEEWAGKIQKFEIAISSYKRFNYMVTAAIPYAKLLAVAFCTVFSK